MSLTFSRYVRFMFHVCPVLELRVISLHLVVPIGFLVLCLPFIPPALPLCSFLSLSCPFQFAFVSLSFPVAFLSCRLPISSPHFLALPCISALLPKYFPQNNTVFYSVFAKMTSKKTEFFQIFGKPKPAKEPAGGIEPGTPVLRTPAPRRLRLVEHHQIAARYVGHPPPQNLSSSIPY